MKKTAFIKNVYTFEMWIQSFFSLLFPIATLALIAFACVKKWNWPAWVYVPFLTVGVIVGFISMVKTLLAIERQMTTVGREHEEMKKAKNENTERK